MKQKIENMVSRVIILTFALMIGAVVSYGQESRGGGRLVGTWDAAVRILDCANGNVLNSFPSIASFNQGGTTIGSTSGMPQAVRTPEHGVWRHVMGNIYQFKFKSFSNFDAITGKATRYTIVAHTIELDDKGDTYYSYGTASFYLINGTPVGGGCSDAIGTRFDF